MVGREIGFLPDREPVQTRQVRLALEKVSCESDRGTPGLRQVSLEVRGGEILGVAGVSGNGQKELAQVTTGLRPVTQGRIYLEGEDVTGYPPGALTDRMLSYIPEERMRDAIITEFSVAENLVLREHHKNLIRNLDFLVCEKSPGVAKN